MEKTPTNYAKIKLAEALFMIIGESKYRKMEFGDAVGTNRK